VHLCDFPVADASRIDKEMEEQMDALVEAVQLGRACRALANMKTRQPAAKLYVKGATFGADYQALCEDELNVKEVVFTDNTRDYTTYQLKPQMRTLGRKYGKLLGAIGQKLAAMDGNEVVDAFARGEIVSFELDGTLVELAQEDVLTAPMQKPGFVAQEDRGVMVVLDTNLTPELIQEGYVREVISKIQTMRKDAGFEVTDRIDVRYTCGEKLADAIASGLDMIKNGTLALTVEMGEADDTYTAQEWKINDQKAVIAVRVAK
jgi:isoleucyl-tRNA synthetase